MNGSLPKSIQRRARSVATPLAFAALLAAVTGRPAAAGTPADFEKTFAALVARNCVNCHNPTDRKGRLDLTRAEGLARGGKNGPVVVPGKPEVSYLVERVAEGTMPPPKKGRRLAPAEVAALAAWVRDGARWPTGRVLSPLEFTTDRRAGYDWWSLQPLGRPAVPLVRMGSWPRNPLDAFVLGKLEEHGLAPAPEADRATYLRRAKYDLLGLPPTPEEIDAFTTDTAPGAYERLLDRLLASPHYGERWGRHWLDVARFGESDGFERDNLREHAWYYRDYVIHSFNADKPYAQFVREQLAGDVLEPFTRDGLLATGFLVAGPWDEIQNVAQSRLEKMRTHEEQIEELIGIVAQAFLGMTVNCARCHDHKFDPIPQTDYYRLKAVFDGVDHGDRPLRTPAEQQAYEAALASLRARVKKLEHQALFEQLKATLLKQTTVSPPLRDETRQALARARAKLKQKEDEGAALLVYSGVRRQPGPTWVLARGDVRKPGRRVTAGGLSAVRSLAADFGLPANAPEGLRRQRFADWVVHPDNPLVARVLVNRLWQYHFGRGLVENPSDLGFNGGRPSHPELLDWLARRFIAGGWSIKAMHRLIMLSATYRQASRYDPQAAARDGDDRLLWRFPPRRLEAETVRDALLAVSGELNTQIGGPSFRPFTVTVFNSHFYHPFDRDEPAFNRRTAYRMSVNTARSPLLAALDCPAPSVAMPKRPTTTTPLQALALMNDSFVLRQADRFARRLRREAGPEVEAQVQRAYRLAFGRAPDTHERAAVVQLAREQGLESACWVLLNASEFLYVR